LDITQRRKLSRQHREAFRKLLDEKHQDGTLNVKTKWKDFLKAIKDDIRYKDMVAPQQIGYQNSLPSELFGDFLGDLEEKFHREKKKVKEILREAKFPVTHKTSMEEFFTVLSANPKFETINPKSHQLLFQEFLHKTEREEKRKEKDADRKKRKTTSRFMDLLESKKINPTTAKWADVRQSLAEHSSFQKLGTEEEREAIFNEFITRRKEDSSSDEEGRIRSASPEDSKHKHKKKHRHHKRHHTDSGSDSESKRKKKAKGTDGTEVERRFKEKGGSGKPPVDYSSSEEEGERKEP